MISDKESQEVAIAAHQDIEEKEFRLKKLSGELPKSYFFYDYKTTKQVGERTFKTMGFTLTDELFSRLLKQTLESLAEKQND